MCRTSASQGSCSPCASCKLYERPDCKTEYKNITLLNSSTIVKYIKAYTQTGHTTHHWIVYQIEERLHTIDPVSAIILKPTDWTIHVFPNMQTRHAPRAANFRGSTIVGKSNFWWWWSNCLSYLKTYIECVKPKLEK